MPEPDSCRPQRTKELRFLGRKSSGGEIKKSSFQIASSEQEKTAALCFAPEFRGSYKKGLPACKAAQPPILNFADT